MGAGGIMLLFGATNPGSPSLDSCDGQVCQAGGNPGCDTLSGCDDTGEKHRVGWTHTNCNDSYHHIAVHRSTDGGSYAEVADNLGCDQADPDAGCCSLLEASYDGEYLFGLNYSSDLGSCTTTHQYRIRIENDGTDTAEDTCTEASAGTGCDTSCSA